MKTINEMTPSNVKNKESRKIGMVWQKKHGRLRRVSRLQSEFIHIYSSKETLLFHASWPPVTHLILYVQKQEGVAT